LLFLVKKNSRSINLPIKSRPERGREREHKGIEDVSGFIVYKDICFFKQQQPPVVAYTAYENNKICYNKLEGPNTALSFVIPRTRKYSVAKRL
jgi:hypothetical protein